MAPVSSGMDGEERSAIPSTLRTYLVNALKNQILEGVYSPGSRLNESHIAREFNVSRVPVREALSQLQEQGLLVSHERRGMFVVQLGNDEVQQINSLRLVLEPEAMRLARARLTPGTREELINLVDQMDAWNGPLLDAAALDRRFHAVIWRASGNPYLERTLHSLTTSLFAHKALEHVNREVRRWRLGHHRELLDFVISGLGDPKLAMLSHLRLAYSDPEKFSSLALEERQ